MASLGNGLGMNYLLVYIALFYVFALPMWYASLQTVKGWIVSALRAIGPVLGAPFVYIFFGQTLSPLQIISAILVLLTSILIAKEHLSKEK